MDYAVTVSLGGVAPTTGVYLVTAYGADPTGVADSTGAINNAIAAAEAAGGGEVVIPKGTYKVTNPIICDHTDADQHLVISAYGAAILGVAGHADAVLQIGAADTTTVNVIVNGGTWGLSTVDWTSTIGISMISANHCTLRDVMVRNCGVGIQLAGRDARGCAYNQINPGRIIDCLDGISLTADVDGWANSNRFFGGSIQYSTALNAVDCSAGYAIRVVTPTSGQHVLNDNHFIAQQLEVSSAHSAADPGAVLVFGEQNTFYGLRIEGFTEPFYVGVTGTISSGAYYARWNKIFTGYQSNQAFTNTVKDDTANERLAFWMFCGQESSIVGGSGTYPALGIRTSSSGYRAIDVFQSAGTTPTFSVSSAGAVSGSALTSTGSVVFGSQLLQLLQYNGSPNGAATAPKGSLASDYANGKLYINTDGGTTWAVVGTQT